MSEMAWRLIETFDPRFHADASREYLLAGVYPNGIRWVRAAYWDPRGHFSGHKLDVFKPRWWQPMPEAPSDKDDEMMRELQLFFG